MKNQPPEVADRFSKCRVGDVVMSAITYAELEYGVETSTDPKQEGANLAGLVEDILVPPPSHMDLFDWRHVSQKKTIWTS
jgi:tRNA(fMet)-specific endonuclease VapC